MREIPLTQGKTAIVDDADFVWLSQWKWQYHRGRHGAYAKRTIWHRGKHSTIWMHRQIMSPPAGFEVDHISGNGCDNRRSCNLRLCTSSQNKLNSKKRRGCSSQYKGVYWNEARQKWYAATHFQGKKYYLGSFENEQDAALAYNNLAADLFGEFARLNEV